MTEMTEGQPAGRKPRSVAEQVPTVGTVPGRGGRAARDPLGRRALFTTVPDSEAGSHEIDETGKSPPPLGKLALFSSAGGSRESRGSGKQPGSAVSGGGGAPAAR